MVATEEDNNRIEEKEGEPKIANARRGNNAGPMATVVTTETPAKTRQQDTSTTPPSKTSKAEVTKTMTGPSDGVGQHRWELPVGNYHGIRGNYHYLFFGVTVLVILHDFICENYHENQSDRYPFFLIMVNYPTFLINYHNLIFQMYYQNLFLFLEYPKMHFFLSASFGIKVLIETIVSAV